MPRNVQEERTIFRVGPNWVVQSGHAFSYFDHRPFKNVIKNYIVRYQQSFGRALTDDDIFNLTQDEMNLYVAHYSALGGIEKKRVDPVYNSSSPRGELYMTYQDKERGEQSIKARIIFTRNGKFEQIVIGPDEIMDTLRTRKFFKSMVAYDGYIKSSQFFSEDWEPLHSPLGIFTTYSPGVLKPYVFEKPVFENSDTVERIGMSFYDPVWRQRMFVNIYGYRMDQNMSYVATENLIRQKHILRHRFSDKKIELERKINNNINVLETEYSIRPPKNNPFANMVKIRALFFDDLVVVHEIVGAPRHVQSKFADNFIRSTMFHVENENVDAQ